jgi:hypothetical protein
LRVYSSDRCSIDRIKSFHNSECYVQVYSPVTISEAVIPAPPSTHPYPHPTSLSIYRRIPRKPRIRSRPLIRIPSLLFRILRIRLPLAHPRIPPSLNRARRASNSRLASRALCRRQYKVSDNSSSKDKCSSIQGLVYKMRPE